MYLLVGNEFGLSDQQPILQNQMCNGTEYYPTTANRMSIIKHDSLTVPQSSIIAHSSTASSTALASQQLFHPSPPTLVSPPAQSLLPLPILQVPATTTGFPGGVPTGGTATAVPQTGFQPVMMQLEGTDQRVMVLIPSNGVSTTAPVAETSSQITVREKGSAAATTLQDSLSQPQVISGGRPSVLVSPSQTGQVGTSSAALFPSTFARAQRADTASPTSVEYQVRMQVAHLQQQLQGTLQHTSTPQTTQSSPHTSYPLFQLPTAPAVTQMTVPSPLKAALAAPNINKEPVPISIHPMPQTTGASPETPVFVPGPQGIVLNTVQPQLLQASHVAQYVSPAGLVQLPELSNLTTVNITQPSSSHLHTPTSSQAVDTPTSIKPLTVVQPTQCLGFGGPATVVLRPGQVFSVMPSPAAHVLLPSGALSNISRS